MYINIDDIKNLKKEKIKINKSKFDYERRINQIDRIIKQSYEDKVNGILNTQEFIKMTEDYQREKEELRLKINNLNKELNSCQDMAEEGLTRIIKNITDTQNIDKNTIISLINKIEIIDSESIKIYYNFSE